MTLVELVHSLELRNFTPSLGRLLRADVAHALAADLPSDMLARARSGALLVTAQSNLNVVAVAARAKLAAVLLTSGLHPDGPTTAHACEQGVLLLGTDLPSFDAVGRLYELGLRGDTR